MKWILTVVILWNSYPVQHLDAEMSSERACKEAMQLVERKLLSDAMISQHNGYQISCEPKESE